MADSTVRVIFMGDSDSATRAVGKLDSRIGGLERSFHRAGKAAAIGLGAALVGSIVAAEKAAIGFDRSMRNVNSIAKLSERQFQAVEKQVLALSEATGQGPKVLADAMYEIVSSGFKARDAMTVLRASARAGAAGMTDAATAGKGIVAVLNAYHLKATDARKVSDVLFQTVNKGVLSFSELSAQIGDVLPLASTLKVPLTDVGGALATITLHGVNAAEASTQLKQVLASIIAPSKDLKKEIKALGYESGQSLLHAKGLPATLDLIAGSAHGNTEALQRFFPNIRALNGVLGLTGGNAKQLAANIDAMSHASDGAGATSKAYAEQAKSIAFQWNKATAALGAAGITLGTQLFPAMAKGITFLSGPGLAGGTRFVHAFAGELGSLHQALAPIEPLALSAAQGVLRFSTMSGVLPGLSAATVAYLAMTRAILGVQLASKTLGANAGMAAFAKSVGAANPAGAAAGLTAFAKSTTGVGIAAGLAVGVLIALAAAEESVGQKARRAASDLLGLQNATLGLKGAQIEAERTGIQQGASARALAKANRELKEATDAAHASFPPTTEGAKANQAALERLTAATRAQRIAANNYAADHQAKVQADQAVAAAREKLAASTEKATAKIADLARTNAELHRIAVTRGIPAGKLEAAQEEIKAAAVRQATSAISAQIEANKQIRPSVAAGFQAVLELIRATGRLPEKKTLSLLLNDAATGKLKDVKRLIDNLHDKSITVAVNQRLAHPFAPTNPVNPTLPVKASAEGNVIDRPTLSILGEDAPTWSEYVIPTNPRHRQRALGLLGQATAALGLPGFAKGGGPSSAGPMVSHSVRKRGPVNLKGVVGDARTAIATLTAAQQRVADLSRTYDQDVRAFSAEILPPLTVDAPDDPSDPSGPTHQVVNAAGVAASVAQFNSLMSEKGGIIAALDDEREKMEAAITAVRAAIDALLAAIKDLQQKAKDAGADARAEHAAATKASNSVSAKGGLQDQVTAERNAKKPSKAKINQLEAAIRQAGREHDSHEASAKRSETNQGRYQQQAQDKASKVKDLRGSLADLGRQRHDLPFDIRDQQLDIADLQKQVVQVQATSVAAFVPSSIIPGATTVTGGGTIMDTLSSDLLAELQRYREAFSLEAAQLNVLGGIPSFQRGTAYVPNDMVAMLHAGESVRTADQTASDFRNQTGQPVVLHVHLGSGFDFQTEVEAVVEGSVPAIIGSIGRSVDTLRREGRLR